MTSSLTTRPGIRIDSSRARVATALQPGGRTEFPGSLTRVTSIRSRTRVAVPSRSQVPSITRRDEIAAGRGEPGVDGALREAGFGGDPILGVGRVVDRSTAVAGLGGDPAERGPERPRTRSGGRSATWS